MGALSDELLDFISRADNPVIFCGAGVSVRAGLPTWVGLLSELAKVAARYDKYTGPQMTDSIDSGSLDVAAAYYFLAPKIPPLEKYQELRAQFNGYVAYRVQGIARIPARAIVTTNYDKALLDAYAAERKSSAIEVNLNDPTLKSAHFETNFYIARIHGRSEVPATIVLSSDHFKELAGNDDYKEYLIHIFSRMQVIFIGFSFLDPAIKSALAVVKSRYDYHHNGRHIALLPSDAASDFIGKLEEYSIKKIFYSADNNHEELWEAIDSIQWSTGQGTDVTIKSELFDITKKYMATCYARLKLGDELVSLRRVVAEGVVAGIIQSSSGGVSITQIELHVATEMSLSDEVASDLVAQSVLALRREGLCEFSDSHNGMLVWIGSPSSALDDSLEFLSAGVMRRYIVRESGFESFEKKELAKKIIKILVLERGWDLGAAFAANKPPSAVDVVGFVNSSSLFDVTKESLDLVGVSRAVSDVIYRPTSEEAGHLSDLGRVAFGLELAIQSSGQQVFQSLDIPSRIYLDANVLMPAITKGHPYYEIYNKLMTSLISAAGANGMDLSVCAYDGFLNEIVSHKRLASDELRRRSDHDLRYISRQILLHGSANVNVFVAAYAAALSRDKSYKFEDFIKASAPYSDESKLKVFLREKGIEVARGSEIQGPDYPKILHLLEVAYSGRLLHRGKVDVVIKHDAVQLSALCKDIKAGRKSIFVTADKALVTALSGSEYGFLGNAIVSHVGLAQLIDLLVGISSQEKTLASLMWSTSVSSEAERIRNYFIDMSLKEHDVAYVMSMHDVIEEISEDLSFELKKKNISLSSDANGQQEELNRVMEAYEDRFFERMGEELEKIRGRGF